MSYLEEHYNNYDEDGRLLSQHGQVEYEEYEKRGGADGVSDCREDAFTNKCVTILEAFVGSLSSKQQKGKTSYR